MREEKSGEERKETEIRIMKEWKKTWLCTAVEIALNN